jgi:HK97 family phage portal protein
MTKNGYIGAGLQKLAGLLWHKSGIPKALAGNQWTGGDFVDAFRRRRNPTANELLAELKNTAFTCISLNAAVCASYPPRLYVATAQDEPGPKCLTRSLPRLTERRLRQKAGLPPRLTRAGRMEEVLEHPLLTLLQQVNPVHNAFDLWELTTLYQEVFGCAYWLLKFGPLDVPEQIWILPSQNVYPVREPHSTQLVDYYEYRVGATRQRFAPSEIIHFRYPDPRDPYTSGVGPLRACFENIALDSTYLAFKMTLLENNAAPGVLLSPDEVMGEEERDRLEQQWNAKFRQGGAGRCLVAESGMKVSILAHSMGDLAALAERGANKEDIVNAFHVPLSYLTSNTNLANLEAAERQHLANAITPRLLRRDEKINEQLLPLFDPSGRLFVASEAPLGLGAEDDLNQLELDLKYGVISINELRGERGLPAVPWGDVPWLPSHWMPTNQPREPEPPDNTSV